MSTITAQDETENSTSPTIIVGWAPNAESGNIVHEMIDGTIAVTLVGDLPRSGDLNLIYPSDDEAEAARLLLARATWFTLTDPTRPVIEMSFVRRGTITPAMHESLDDVWSFRVGFQEIIP